MQSTICVVEQVLYKMGAIVKRLGVARIMVHLVQHGKMVVFSLCHLEIIIYKIIRFLPFHFIR